MSCLKTARAMGLALALIPFPYALLAAESEAVDYQLTLDQMRTFTEVFARIKQDYVEPVNDKVLIESAIRGMLSNLDPHTEYLDAAEFTQLEENTTGQFTGIGIEVVEQDGQILVVSPIDDTPAAKAGIKAGDVITAINGVKTAEITLEEAVEMIRGKPGTTLELAVTRKGLDTPLEITVARDIIEIKSVAWRLLEDGFGYVRISAFQNDTAENLRRALVALSEEEGALKGLVLDLRNNPGGVLHSAVNVADLFLKGGLIVYTEGRTPSSELRFNADAGHMVGGVPMVVLINSGTASASEIVAGALKDQQRAVLLGETSFGKGSVQTVLPLGGGKAVKLTTALYYTPNGRSIQALGIAPDITVQANGYHPEEAIADAEREADLAGHLEVERETSAGAERTRSEMAEDDFQLYQALNLLKGVSILSRNAGDK